MRNKIIIGIILGIGVLLGALYLVKQYNTIGLTKKAAEEGNIIAQQNLAIYAVSSQKLSS
jgi:hypothetical protein